MKDFRSLGRRGESGASGLCVDSSCVRNSTTVEVVKTVLCAVQNRGKALASDSLDFKRE